MTKDKQIIKAEEKAPTNFIETLIRQAITDKAPVETMERILDLQKRMHDEWAKGQYDRAMAKFQSECPIIQKRKKVAFNTTKYNYAPLESIIEEVQYLLSKNGFSYTFDTKSNGKMKVFCKVKHVDGHSEVSEFEMEIDTNAKMNTSQKYGSASTYGKRYAFINAFGITVKDEDDDAVSVKKNEEIKELDNQSIAKINAAKTDEELVKVCHELKLAQPKNVKAILVHFNRRRDELIDELNEEADKALEK